MKWRIKEAKKQYTCILCRESIGIGEEYIRPPHRGLAAPVSSPHKTTWGERPPYFHVDCFKNLKRLYNPAAPVERLKNDRWKRVKI
jgi:hypothetical protein